MKKIIMIAVAVLTMTTAASAQTEKGTIYGAARVSGLDLEFMPDFRFGLSAEGGYFLANNFALTAGLRLGFANNTNNFGLSVGGRYNFTRSFFAGADLNFNKWKGVDATFGLGIFAGYSLFLTDKIAIEPLLRLGIPFTGGDIELGLSAGFGFYF